MPTDAETVRTLLDTMKWLYGAAQEHNVDAVLLEADRTAAQLIERSALSLEQAVQLLYDFLYQGRAETARRLVGYARGHRVGDGVLAEIDRLLAAAAPGAEAGGTVKALYLLRASGYDQAADRSAAEAAFRRLLKPVALPRLATALDLGCGTGWAGRLLRRGGFAGRLIGVDLSAAMLAVARSKGLYDLLLEADLHDALAATGERPDLVVMAWVSAHLNFDQMCRLIVAIERILAPGGLFLFDALIVGTDSACLTGRLGLPHWPSAAVEGVLKDTGFSLRSLDADLKRFYRCHKRD